MIPAVILGWFRTNPRNMWAFLFLMVAIGLLVFVYAKGRSDNARKERARDAIAMSAALETDRRADDASTGALAVDVKKIAVARKELEDEVAKVADGTPTPADVLYGCRELQRNGISTANLPACPPSRPRD